jgi:hypothetical protein
MTTPRRAPTLPPRGGEAGEGAERRGSSVRSRLSQFETLVSEGKVRYLVAQGGACGGARGGQSPLVVSWAEVHGKKVTISGLTGVTVYDLQGAAAT